MIKGVNLLGGRAGASEGVPAGTHTRHAAVLPPHAPQGALHRRGPAGSVEGARDREADNQMQLASVGGGGSSLTAAMTRLLQLSFRRPRGVTYIRTGTPVVRV